MKNILTKTFRAAAFATTAIMATVGLAEAQVAVRSRPAPEVNYDNYSLQIDDKCGDLATPAGLESCARAIDGDMGYTVSTVAKDLGRAPDALQYGTVAKPQIQTMDGGKPDKTIDYNAGPKPTVQLEAPDAGLTTYYGDGKPPVPSGPQDSSQPRTRIVTGGEIAGSGRVVQAPSATSEVMAKYYAANLVAACSHPVAEQKKLIEENAGNFTRDTFNKVVNYSLSCVIQGRLIANGLSISLPYLEAIGNSIFDKYHIANDRDPVAVPPAPPRSSARLG